MNTVDQDYIRRILSVAETGKAEWDASAVYIYADDNRFNPARRQITLSIGFTESGNLKTVLERYIELGGELSSHLRSFLPGLGSQARGSLAGNQAFIDLLKKAGKETKMRQAQTEMFDRLYLNPASVWAETYGFKLPLSVLVIADSFLHSGSMLGFLIAKFPEKKPNAGGDEKSWITDYLNVRKNWLANHSNKILNKTVYRANCYLIEASKGNWNLATSLVMNGTTVSRVV
jgi:chitosanase